jgi:hypothetical protein
MAATTPPDPGGTDLASRLVRAIKSAMGIAETRSVTGGQRLEQADAVASPKLRVLYVAVAAILLALWGWSLVPAIQNWNNPNEDGFSLMPGSFTTFTLLPLGYMTLMGGIFGHGRSLRRARMTFVIGLAFLALLLAFEIFRRMSNASGA